MMLVGVFGGKTGSIMGMGTAVATMARIEPFVVGDAASS